MAYRYVEILDGDENVCFEILKTASNDDLVALMHKGYGANARLLMSQLLHPIAAEWCEEEFEFEGSPERAAGALHHIFTDFVTEGRRIYDIRKQDTNARAGQFLFDAEKPDILLRIEGLNDDDILKCAVLDVYALMLHALDEGIRQRFLEHAKGAVVRN